MKQSKIRGGFYGFWLYLSLIGCQNQPLIKSSLSNHQGDEKQKKAIESSSNHQSDSSGSDFSQENLGSETSDLDTTESLDPLEPMNRMFFSLNHFLDRILIVPFATMYREVVPSKVQKGFRSFMSNLMAPLTCIHNLLQGEGTQAAQTISRFGVNTVFGLGGLVSVTELAGIQTHETNLSETFRKWGVKKGPYLVLPILGSSTFRGTTGLIGDWFLDPWYYYVKNPKRYTNRFRQEQHWFYGFYATNLLDQRSQYLEFTKDLESSSVDLYSATRSLYLQKQDALDSEQDSTENGS